MTRVTFGMSASSFAANMAVNQNAFVCSLQYPLAFEKSFYVDNCLSGEDSVSAATELRLQLQELFNKGGFLLRKWISSEKAVLQDEPAELVDTQSTHSFADPEIYTDIGHTLELKSGLFPPQVLLNLLLNLPPLNVFLFKILASYSTSLDGTPQLQSRTRSFFKQCGKQG